MDLRHTLGITSNFLCWHIYWIFSYVFFKLSSLKCLFLSSPRTSWFISFYNWGGYRNLKISFHHSIFLWLVLSNDRAPIRRSPRNVQGCPSLRVCGHRVRLRWPYSSRQQCRTYVSCPCRLLFSFACCTPAAALCNYDKLPAKSWSWIERG